MRLPSLGILFSESLGFDITFKGPAPELDDIFFGIVRRSAAMITFKDVGVDPVPNYTQGVKKGIAAGTPTFMSLIRDGLSAEFSSRNVAFFEPSRVRMMAWVDPNFRPLTAKFCLSAGLVHELRRHGKGRSQGRTLDHGARWLNETKSSAQRFVSRSITRLSLPEGDNWIHLTL